MWLPYTDSVVVVQVNPDGPPAKPAVPRSVRTDAASDQDSTAGSGSGSSMSAYGDVVQEDNIDAR